MYRNNVRLNKKKCQSGMDALEFAITFDDIKGISFAEEKLPNSVGKSIVKIKCTDGRISGSVSAVHCIRDTNANPFTLADAIKMELIRNNIFAFIRSYLKKNLGEKFKDKHIDDLRVTSLEVNVTRPCLGRATPSDMAHLFDMVFDRATVYKERKSNSKCEKENTGIAYEKKHEYQLKIYDKERDLRRQGVPIVEKGLFRIEIKFKDRKLNAMFGADKRTLDNVLSAKALDIMCRTYKNVFEEDIIPCIKEYLENCVELLFCSLTRSDRGKEISDTVARYKDIIVDFKCLERALHKWYKHRGVEDRTKQILYKYRQKNLGIPDDVLMTLKAFHQAAG